MAGFLANFSRKKFSTKESSRLKSQHTNPNANINLLDSRDDIIKKFKKAVTDSEALVKYDESRPGIANLMSIYSGFTGKSFDEIEKEFEGKGYGYFKLAVGEACADALAPIQEKFNQYMSDKAFLESVMKEGAEKAASVAYRTLGKVYRKVGFYPRVR